MTHDSARHDELKRMLIERQQLVVKTWEGVDIDILISRKAEELTKLNEALSLLEQGIYGRCAHCNAEMPLPWLRALMYTNTCKQCWNLKDIDLQRQVAKSKKKGLFEN